MREFEGCKKKAEGKDIWGKIEVTTEKLTNRALKKHGKKETASSERSWDASLGAPQAEVLHCIYIALSAKYPKAIHSVCWAVWVLALTPITNTHLAPWGRTPHSCIWHSHACFCTTLWEELPSITHFVPQWVSSSCVWSWYGKRDFKKLSMEEWEKTVSTETRLRSSQQNYQAVLHFLLYSASWQSVNSRLRIKLNCR